MRKKTHTVIPPRIVGEWPLCRAQISITDPSGLASQIRAQDVLFRSFFHGPVYMKSHNINASNLFTEKLSEFSSWVQRGRQDFQGPFFSHRLNRTLVGPFVSQRGEQNSPGCIFNYFFLFTRVHSFHTG